MFLHTIGVIPLTLFSSVLLSCAYIVYQRCFHPLAKYPGPFLASLTDLWKVYQMSKMQMPYRLTELHEKHGSILRIGPNTLSFTDPEAIAPIYQSGSRAMQKTEFYDSFTTFNPNLFGTRDENYHSMRRRQMSYAFSMANVLQMEQYVDQNISILRSRLDRCIATGEVFCLKEYIATFIIDVLGDLAFSRSFHAQTSGNPENIPPVKDHLLLACTMGQIPSLLPLLKIVCQRLPFPWFQRLYRSRAKLRQMTSQCVKARIEKPSDRKDLLSSLIGAIDPDTGAQLSTVDIETEAFGFIIAGTHSTGGTLALLFWHLLHNPEIMQRCVTEVQQRLPEMQQGQVAYSIEGLEKTLEYTMACVKENFRISPVFNMPLGRRVLSKCGINIAGEHIPYNTNVMVINHCAHHNATAWGSDHDVFDPSRWTDGRTENMDRHLIPFSIGHRMCIGKTIAMTNILKVTSTLLSCYEFEAVDKELKQPEMVSVGVAEMVSPMQCRVKSRSRNQ